MAYLTSFNEAPKTCLGMARIMLGLSNKTVISNPDLTLFDAERWDLVKFDTTQFFIGYCEKECRDNTLTVIGSF